MSVHNHGPSQDRGLECPERMVDGELKGACLQPMTLTEFLLARIAEDKEHAKRAAFGWGREWTNVTDDVEEWSTVHADGKRDMVGCEDEDVTRHIARHDPARVLAKCEADRRIVETHRHADYSFGNSQAECPSMPRPLAESMTLRYPEACDTLLLLAAVHVDHDDFRPEWRP